MKCPRCGGKKWRVLVTEYKDFLIEGKKATVQLNDIAVATILESCLGGKCGHEQETTLNRDEYETYLGALKEGRYPE